MTLVELRITSFHPPTTAALKKSMDSAPQHPCSDNHTRGCKNQSQGNSPPEARRWSPIRAVVGTAYIAARGPRVGANNPKSLVQFYSVFSGLFFLVFLDRVVVFVSAWQSRSSVLCYRHSNRTHHTCIIINQTKVPRLHGYPVIASSWSAKLLPKLAISAKVLLCLLMVAISEGTPVIRQVRLLNKGSSSWVNVNYKGLVSLKEVQDGYEELRFVSERVGRVKIYGEKSNRWLCYNRRWKLVGKLNGTEGQLGDLCVFSEEMYENYYYIYRPIKDPKRLMGFRSDGRQIRARLRNQQPSGPYFFSKIDEGFNHDLISKHNEIISAPNSVDQRSDYSVPIPVPVHSETVTVTRQRNNRHRHRHGNRRRKLPNNNTAAV